MKKILELLSQITGVIGGKIKKSEIPISMANGMPVPAADKHALSYEKAKQIIENYQAYDKESAQYRSDETKIVLPKVFFLNFLKTSKLDLCLFQHINETGWTTFHFEKKVEEAFQRVPSIAEAVIRDVIFPGMAILALYFIWFTQFVIALDDSTRQDPLFARIVSTILVLAVLAVLTLTRIGFKERHAALSARKEFPKMSFFDIVGRVCTDSKATSTTGSSSPNTRMKFFPGEHFAVATAQCVRFGGTLGYLISTSQSIVPSIHSTYYTGDTNKVQIEYTGKVLPLILLNHTVIIYKKDAEDFYETPTDRYAERHVEPLLSSNKAFALFLSL